MNIQGKHYRTIWWNEREECAEVIDQRQLPFAFHTVLLRSVKEVHAAIADMTVRGAPLIGITGAYGICLAARKTGEWDELKKAAAFLNSARPTAINLSWATGLQLEAARLPAPGNIFEILLENAGKLADQDVQHCTQIGRYGLEIIREIFQRKGTVVNILTHCNAGWLACIDWGTATSPIYQAHREGIPVHVWVDETRPRLQGAKLTAFELQQEGVPFTVIADNAGGHLMQHGLVDAVIVGSDRTTASGDVCNKIGTYLKALAAADNGIPFYAALPSSTIDWTVEDGVHSIPIEERNENEIHCVEGVIRGENTELRITPENTRVSNYGFDVTPARLVTGIITERGVANASREGLRRLFPEKQTA